MAEGKHFPGGFVHVGDRPARHQHQVPPDEGRAHRTAGLQRGSPGLRSRAGTRGAGEAARGQFHSELAEQGGQGPVRGGTQAAGRDRRANGKQLPAVALDPDLRDRRRVEGRLPGGRELEGGRRRNAGRGSRGQGHFGEPDHFLERSDAADGILGEGEGIRHGAEEPPVHVDRTAAHPLHDARVGEGAAGQVGEHDAAARHRAVQHPDDLHPEALDFLAGEDGAALADHSRPHFLERQDRGLGGGLECSARQCGECAHERKMGSQDEISEGRNATAASGPARDAERDTPRKPLGNRP